jgi:hypothetical protein
MRGGDSRRPALIKSTPSNVHTRAARFCHEPGGTGVRRSTSSPPQMTRIKFAVGDIRA